jgi:hypothetical protein
MRAMLGLLRIT